MQTPLAELEIERTGTIHLGKGVLCISEMQAVFGPRRLLSLLNGYEGTKGLLHICLEYRKVIRHHPSK